MMSTTPPVPGRLIAGVVFILLLLLNAPAQAQGRYVPRFKAGLIAGLTASQIDGDESAGYHKLGLQGGLRGIIGLKEKQDASIELLFTQRGCRNQPKTFPEFSVTLDYVEVPLQWHYHDWAANEDSDKPDFYRVHFNVGVSYARLLNYQDKYGFTALSLALPDLNRNSFCFLIGASLYVTRHLAFTVRYHRAINRLYQPGKSGTNYAKSLNEHFLAFQTMYVF